MRPLVAILTSPNEGDGAETVPRAYVQAVADAGGVPVLVPCLDDETAVHGALSTVQGVLITGGVDVDPACYGQQPHPKLGTVSPSRDALDRIVVRWLLQRPEVPALCICRGIQALNVFAGGTLIQDIPSQVPSAIEHSQSAPRSQGTHLIRIEAGSVFAQTVGAEPLLVNSFHHQAVQDVAPGFRAVAWTSDGVIEAIEREEARYCVGVQFHPEHTLSSERRVARLFEALVTG